MAFAAGLIAFLSPCVLPLAPGYVSYMTGLTGAELADGRKSRMLLGSVLFVLGFSVVFVSFGAFFGGVGSILLQYQDVITRVLGVAVIMLVNWRQVNRRNPSAPMGGRVGACLDI